MKGLVIGVLAGFVLGASSVGATWFFTSRSEVASSAERIRVIAYATTGAGRRDIESAESLGNGLWRLRWSNGACFLFDMKHFVDGIPKPLDC
jgi:hypothetical protein